MSNNKKGLGKGLGALFADLGNGEEVVKGEERPIVADPQPEEISREIPIYKIVPNINQPRRSFDPASITELANSIRVHGVISPIIVTRRGDSYMIIAGERRFRAAKEAGLTSMPCIVRTFTMQEIREISLIENLQREDLNPIEAANAMKVLMDEHSFTQEQLAQRLGLSRPAIANAIRLLTLAPEVIRFVEEGRLSAGHARCLVVLDSAELQFKFANEACDNKMSVRQLEKAIKDYQNSLKKPAQKKQMYQSLELKELVSNMQRIFATKVSALGNDKRGRIYIDYYSRDDLDRIVDLLVRVEKPSSEDEN